MTNENEIPQPTVSSRGSKRRGLTLPPRGQALSRLQDLEQEAPEEADTTATPSEKSSPGIDAVNTASSNAVNDAVIQEGSNAVHHAGSIKKIPEAEVAQVPEGQASEVSRAPRAAPSLRAAAAREPTTRITVDMPDSLHKQLSFLSVETRRSIKDLVLEALTVTYFQAEEDAR